NLEALTALFLATPWLQTASGLLALAGAATVANLLVKRVILGIVVRTLDAMSVTLEAPMIRPTVQRLANVVPAIVIARGVAAVPHLPAAVETVTANVCGAFIILTLAL